jgi:PIN domain nuclease of toxin-antitoxin system
MRLLLDTCTFLWVIGNPAALSPPRARAVSGPRPRGVPERGVSLGDHRKACARRLPLPESPEHFVPRMRERHGIEALAIDEESVLQTARLPGLHRDPFDRLLVCQSIVHGMTLLTPDALIAQYPARVVW